MPTEWLFVQLYPGASAALDDTVTRVVRPARAEAVALGADRWFFVRYLDQAGPHVRLRVRGETDAINAIHGRWRDSLRAAMAGSAARPSPEGAKPDVAFAPYEPEYEKYGGPLGVDLAERAFEACSEAALDLLAASPGAPERLAMTTLVMERLAGCYPEVAWAAFWDHHHRFWTRPSSPAAADSLLTGESDAALRQLEARLLRQPGIASCLDRMAAATAAALMAAAAAEVPRTAEHLLLHHLHMAVNRLGVVPRQEARLGLRIARSPRSRCA